MYSLKNLAVFAALAIFTAIPDTAEAQYYSGSYTTFYAPSTSYYGGGYTSYYGGGTSTGYTSYYGGGGYGGNPFAPLVPSPYFGRSWFGSGYTAAYGPVGYGGGCCSPCGGCSPCGSGCSSGGCASGNCSVPASSEQLKPAPDNGVPMNEPMDTEEPMPRTYDETEMPPTDDPGFREGDSDSETTGGGSFPGGFEENESFKIPAGNEGNEVPEESSQPEITPLDAEKPSSVPEALYVPSTKPITPRNSARVEPASHLNQRITWRSRPVIVPARQKLTASRPLIVRKTVKVQLNPTTPTLVSQSGSGR